MPELPEVETIARKLRRTIAGKRIAGVFLSGKTLRRPMPGDLAPLLKGRTILSIHRRGKYLILEMKPHAFWLIHLGMSGRLIYTVEPRDRPEHTHAAVQFSDGGELQFCDPRRFGLMDFYQVAQLEALPELQRLGQDPLGAAFNADWLLPELSGTRRDLNSFLLDQHKIAGLGNIYVCEAMFGARIHPCRRCNTLTRKDAAALSRAVQKILRAAIRNRGTTFSDFTDSDGHFGSHQDFLHVFQREGEKCHRCRATIGRIKQGNRSTYYCPGCQKGKPESRGKKG
jgi:formamidopyrimidine-DNA glycosylase